MAFATLIATLRTDVVALWILIGNLGSSIGISIVIAQLTSSTTMFRSQLAETMTPFSIGLPLSGTEAYFDLSTATGQSLVEQTVLKQAAIMAYSNDYLLMFDITLIAFPLLLLMRKSDSAGPAPVIAED